MTLDGNFLKKLSTGGTVTQNEVLRRTIKGVLAFHGLKQRPLAKKYGVSEAHFSEMLTGTRRFKEDVLINVLHELNIYTWAKENGLI